MSDLKQQIKQAIKAFATGKPLDRGRKLLNVLGYQSDITETIAPNNWAGFKAQFVDDSRPFIEGNARVTEWQTVDLIFQLGEENLKHQNSLFTGGRFDNKAIYSYVFFCITLSGESYNRTDLARITREVNKLFDMPAMLFFRYGDNLTITNIDRRDHKRDGSKDVMEKVTLIKDISIVKPHRAHIDILYGMAFDNIGGATTFVALHNAWRKILDTKTLNEQFYKELSAWYYYAIDKIKLPISSEFAKDDKENVKNFVIRLICRTLFCWFLKEKGLIQKELLELYDDTNNRRTLVKNPADSGFDKENSYYRGILQNVFFACLNAPMKERSKDKFYGKKYLMDGFDFGLFSNAAVAKYSLLVDKAQLFASKYSLILPTEDELKAELERDRALLEITVVERKA